MDERIKTIITYIGVILGIIIIFRYIFPIVLSLLGFVITILVSIFMWVAIIIIAILLVNYIVSINKNNS